jgi:hypothetical protein
LVPESCENVYDKFILFFIAAYNDAEGLIVHFFLPSNTRLLSLMGNLLYLIAVVLILVWALGFFGILGAGMAGNNLIHILLVIAIIAILLRVISGRRPV